jgi:hypothetical protein
MFDTRAWRGPAVVGGDGIEPPTSTELAEYDPRGAAGAPSLAAGLRQPVSLDRLVEDEVVEGLRLPTRLSRGPR